MEGAGPGGDRYRRAHLRPSPTGEQAHSRNIPSYVPDRRVFPFRRSRGPLSHHPGCLRDQRARCALPYSPASQSLRVFHVPGDLSVEELFNNLLEWVNIAARWIHVFAGIMWVGQTYFFTWLEGRFSEMTDQASAKDRDEHVWMVHSGGFYLVGKQSAPRFMPLKLHWFRWEAAITWFSGIALLVLVYYAGGLMVNENMESTIPIVVGIAAIVFPWIIYDALWRSKLSRNQTLAVCISYVLLVGVIIGLTHVMEGRAAYIHVGAMLGTIMTANVWMRILPAQRKMVASLKEGK